MYAAIATAVGVLAVVFGGCLLWLGLACARRRGRLYQKLLQLDERTRDEAQRARSLLDLVAALVLAVVLAVAPPDIVHSRWLESSTRALMLVIAFGAALAGVLSLAAGAGLFVLARSLL